MGFVILNQHLKRHFVSKIPLVFNLHLLRRTTIKKYNKLNIERNKIMTLVRFTGNPLIDRFLTQIYLTGHPEIIQKQTLRCHLLT